MELSQNDTILFGEGWVWHSRSRLANSFRYPIFNLLIPIHSDQAFKKLERKRFLSVSSKNYLNSADGDLRQNFFHFLKTELNYSCDQVWLQTLPGIFGYVFNPVSFWYCYKAGKLDAVVCEVNNTFGDRHFYFVQNIATNSSESKKIVKRFHVSPFMDISGYYTFEFSFSGNGNQVRICLFNSDNSLKLDTHIKLGFVEFDQISIFYILKRYGWLTFMVIWRIHFQALKLWFKGAKFYKRPQPPKEKITYDSASI